MTLFFSIADLPLTRKAGSGCGFPLQQRTRLRNMRKGRKHQTSRCLHHASRSSRLTLICWCLPRAERLASSLIADCLCALCFWTPLQQTSSPFNQRRVSAVLVLFAVFTARVYASVFLLCCGSVPSCFMIGPDDRSSTESWCPCLPQSQWAVVLQCLCQNSLFLQSLRSTTGVNMSFSFPSRWLLCFSCCRQWPGVMFQVYFRELSHRRGLQGDKPDHSTEKVFVCLCPTHVLLGPFLSPLTSLSVPWPVGAGRLNVTTPSFSSVPPEDPPSH